MDGVEKTLGTLPNSLNSMNRLRSSLHHMEEVKLRLASRNLSCGFSGGLFHIAIGTGASLL